MSLEEFLQLGVFLRFCKLQFILADTDGSGSITLKESATSGAQRNPH
jgi:hypothetical protein